MVENARCANMCALLQHHLYFWVGNVFLYNLFVCSALLVQYSLLEDLEFSHRFVK